VCTGVAKGISVDRYGRATGSASPLFLGTANLHDDGYNSLGFSRRGYVHSLIDEVAGSIMSGALKKRIFSAPYIPFQRYLGCYQEAFEAGVVLGYAFRDRLTTLAKLFSQPGREEELVRAMQELAQRKLTGIGKAENFLELAMFAEEHRVEANWLGSGIDEAQIEFLKKHLKMLPQQAFKNLHGAVSVGIGFGSAFAELTERLWKAVYERPIDRNEWQKWRNAGLDIGDELPEPLPLAKRQEQLLSLVELFVSKARPELLPQFRMPPRE